MPPQANISSGSSYNSYLISVKPKKKQNNPVLLSVIKRKNQEPRQLNSRQQKRKVSVKRMNIEEAGVIDFGFVNSNRGLIFSADKMRHDFKYIGKTFAKSICKPLEDDVRTLFGLKKREKRKSRRGKTGFWNWR